jgi:hypothetical protein
MFAGRNNSGRAGATLDYFARSFAPELGRYSVAALDSNGNLVLHIGRYGNCDSAGPKSLVPLPRRRGRHGPRGLPRHGH